MNTPVLTCELLVIGGSTAGCFAAITARERGVDVLVVDKGYAGQSGAGIMASGFGRFSTRTGGWITTPP